MADVPKGRLTFRFAAVCFGLSAVWELSSLQGAALLFGHVVDGYVAWMYHIVYIALFVWLALGLWSGIRMTFYVLLATTVLYTVDRLQALFVGDALAAQIHEQLAGNEQLLQLVGMDYLLWVLTVATMTIVFCWWGFVGYAYYRRDYFSRGRKPRAN